MCARSRVRPRWHCKHAAVLNDHTQAQPLEVGEGSGPSAKRKDESKGPNCMGGPGKLGQKKRLKSLTDRSLPGSPPPLPPPPTQDEACPAINVEGGKGVEEVAAGRGDEIQGGGGLGGGGGR